MYGNYIEYNIYLPIKFAQSVPVPVILFNNVEEFLLSVMYYSLPNS